MGEVNFANRSLRVVRPPQQLDDDDDDDDSCEDSRDDDDDDDVDDDYCDATTAAVTPSVLVSNIPKWLTEDYLLMFLENSRRSGGGDVDSIQFDEKSATAVVSFASSQGN